MDGKEIYIFGPEIFPKESKQDAISSLPLELSWKIFSYLDDLSLRTASHTSIVWKNIMLACKNLKKRLNKFELVFTLGSKSLAKFYRRNKRKMKKETKKAQNFLPVSQRMVETTKTTIFKGKRKGDDILLSSKRFKLF